VTAPAKYPYQGREERSSRRRSRRLEL